MAIRLLVMAGFAIVLWLSASRIHLSLMNIILGVPSMADFFSRMFPPDFTILLSLLPPTAVTAQIAAWGTVIAVVASAPLALLAALRPSPHRIVYFVTRLFLTLLRSINELIY